ncbi:hypothetical protein LVJ94_04315 [Pendulispora rubella]|uniref:Uncharacterized protein n=1 Tax=Pendulispora rubella TaxID=2741070 RepID=A0ABZ2L6S3_9BACT
MATFGIRWCASLLLLVSGCSIDNGTTSSQGDEVSAVQAVDGTRQYGDILTELQNLQNVVEVKEEVSRYPNTRAFVLQFRQPVDHYRPRGATFTERVRLLFRSYDAPMVILTSGYGLPPLYLSEPAGMLNANQLMLEHRFFGPSTPDSVDWKKLDIFQAASDEHRIVEALRPLFKKKWLSTGASKGGMTAVYHRFFYPRDVDVTVPYVAPNSFGPTDERYASFLQNVGSAECRDKVRAVQTEVLRRRPEFEARLAEEAAARGDGYEHLGIHKGLDWTVSDLAFTFWQYMGRPACPLVPSAGATSDELYGFLDRVGMIGAYGDASLDQVAAYYYQGATELGGPECDTAHLGPLLTPGFRCDYAELAPLGVHLRFRYSSMPAVAAWVHFAAERMLFVYGEEDPWSSGAFTVREKNDSYRYVVPQGTHGAHIGLLPPEQAREAYTHIFQWMDVPIPEGIAPSDFSAFEAESMIDQPPRRRGHRPSR